ncbi:MAG TPA: OmpA family protein [Pseudomonadales bacterium]|nr:OmpA family protein [Pseudomonadales bacterium]
MKNKLAATFAATALALGVSAAAQADAHPYAGLNLGYVATSEDMHLGDVSAVGGQVGYHFNEDWSIEAAYAANNPYIAPKHQRGGDHQIGMTSANLAYRVWSNDAVTVSGLLGLQHVEMDHAPSSKIDDSATLPTLGVAVSHYFTDQIELRGSVQAGYNRGVDYSDLYSAVALNYHFGTHEAKAAAPVAPAAVAPAAKAEPVVIMKKTLHAHFDHDRAVVRAEDKKEIAEVAEAMKNNPGSKADLVGHTDSTGTDAYNQALSERRAAAVKAEMVKQGASASAISTSGKGEKEPVADNATAKGRAENRRVEAVVTGE